MPAFNEIGSRPPLTNVTPGSAHHWHSRLLLGAGLCVLAAALIVLAARFLAFDTVLTLATHAFSADGVTSLQSRSKLGRLLIDASLAGVAVALVLIYLSNVRRLNLLQSILEWDALRLRGLTTPDPGWVLLTSSTAGVLIAGSWILHKRIGLGIGFVFAKEGPLEYVTFVLELLAALLCGIAAVRWKKRGGAASGRVALLFATCAAALFVVGMEEISWGQTLFRFHTPEGWAHINYQRETTLHNLVDKTVLTNLWKVVALMFGLATLGFMAWSARAPASIVATIAPAPSLALLALIVTYSGLRLHPEIIEVLLSIFFAFYSYRIFVASRAPEAGSSF